jgi:hypothetical protein
MRAQSTGAAALIEREPREHVGEEKPQRRRLGAGRSGEVWLVETPHGRSAVKVFFGDTLSNLVHYIVSGAPNPYIWNEDAIRAAYERRHILKVLASAWFGGVLRVSNALGLDWNADARAWELATEFVDGAPVQLLHPLRTRNPQLDELREEVMAPLQQHLEEAGFDGAVWQAGRGNPVALNNFLWLNPAGSRDARFAFIDLESGVPALFPMNPLELLRYYLPRSWRHGHALFDDVDVPRLSRYVEERRREFGAALGPAALDELEARIDRLAHHQSRWRALDRAEAGIAYQLAKGRLSGPQAEYFRRHRLRWYTREAWRAAGKLAAFELAVPVAVWGYISSISPRAIARNVWHFVSSPDYRTEIARNYVEGRIGAWHDRAQLTDEDAGRLRRELARNESATYLTDFGAHLGMKATFQTLELTVLAALAAAGMIGIAFVAIIIALDGLIYRSVYTLYRMAQAAAARQPLPWLALLVGLVPLLGSLAYPAQMVYSAREREEPLARFTIYDTFTRLGTRLPIWGGKDTLVEHWFNRLAHRIARPAS